VYTIRYSIQFANTDNAQHTATAWLQKNGADVANSATTFSVPARKSASIPGFICAYSEATFTVAVGDEIELYWATDQADVVSPAADGIFLFHDAAQASPFPRPAIPSVIGSISWVSAIPPA
jgi:plastocyanin